MHGIVPRAGLKSSISTFPLLTPLYTNRKAPKSSVHASALIFNIIARLTNVEVKNYLHLYQPLDIQCPYTLIWRWR